MSILPRLLPIPLLLGAIFLTALLLSNRIENMEQHLKESAALRDKVVATRDAGTLVQATHSGSDSLFSRSYTLVETSTAIFKTEPIVELLKGQSLQIQKRGNDAEYLCSDQNGGFCALLTSEK